LPFAGVHPTVPPWTVLVRTTSFESPIWVACMLGLAVTGAPTSVGAQPYVSVEERFLKIQWLVERDTEARCRHRDRARLRVRSARESLGDLT
jgi:hypothetical protein